jgi:hypothetical protein
MNNQTAHGLRKDAAEARRTARDARQVIRSTHNPNLIHFMLEKAHAEEARAQELDRQADALDGGKPAPWWRLFPIPSEPKR